jgi:hypothetical protein
VGTSQKGTWSSGYLLGSVDTSLDVTLVGGYILCYVGEWVLVHLRRLVASLGTSQEINCFSGSAGTSREQCPLN